MKYIEKLIKEELGISAEDYGKIKYVTDVIITEMSKIFIMLLFFLVMGMTKEYIGAIVILLLIRTNSGGLHFRSYFLCTFVSFVVLVLSVLILPSWISISKVACVADMFICLVVSLFISPVRSVYRDEASKEMIKKCHEKVFVYIFVFMVVLYIFPLNSITVAMFWTVNLQMIQLIIANIINKLKL
jgi:accessory gene regulator B